MAQIDLKSLKLTTGWSTPVVATEKISLASEISTPLQEVSMEKEAPANMETPVHTEAPTLPTTKEISLAASVPLATTEEIIKKEEIKPVEKATSTKRKKFSFIKKEAESTSSAEASISPETSLDQSVEKGIVNAETMEAVPDFSAKKALEWGAKEGDKIQEFFPNLIIGIESEDQIKQVQKVAEDLSKARKGGLNTLFSPRVITSFVIVGLVIVLSGIGSYFYLPKIVKQTKTSAIEGVKVVQESIHSGALSGGTGSIFSASFYKEGIDYIITRGNKRNQHTETSTETPSGTNSGSIVPTTNSGSVNVSTGITMPKETIITTKLDNTGITDIQVAPANTTNTGASVRRIPTIRPINAQ